MNNKLGAFENTLNFCIWTFACFYSLSELYMVQSDILKNKPILIQQTLTGLNPGWNFLQRLKDESDIEWISWKFLIQSTWLYMLLQFLISEIIRTTNTVFLKHWYIISCIFYIVNYMGVRQLAMVLIQPVIFWGILYCGGKRKTIWVTSIVLLAIFNSLKYKHFMWYVLDTDFDEDVFIMAYAVPWILLRCISFCVDHVDKVNKTEISDQDKPVALSVTESLLNMFSYVLYLPVLFLGPLILYEEFERSFQDKNETLTFRIRRFIWDILLYLIYTLLLDLSLHYIYFYAMQTNIKAIEMLTSTALCGGGLWMGLEFYFKYVIMYGISASYSRLDHIDAPPTPRCVLRIHLYSQMWRYFDVGLYKFLFKYIHAPVYKTIKSNTNMTKLCCKLISSFITYIFIFIWHGTTWNIFVWSFLNYIGIMLEHISKAIGESEQYKWFKEKVLGTDKVEARFIAFLCAPMLCLSAISSFYLFSNNIGHLYLGLFNSPSILKFVLAYISFYSSYNVSVLFRNLPSRTDRIDKKSV